MAPGSFCNSDTLGYTITYTSDYDYATVSENWIAKYFDRLEKIAWLRYSWKFNRYKMHTSNFILPNIKLVIRKMILSYSGWLARKGYKKKKGK